MKSKTKIALLFGIIIYTLTAMILTPWGSTNPSDIGFYTSLGSGALFGILMYFALKKFWANP